MFPFPVHLLALYFLSLTPLLYLHFPSSEAKEKVGRFLAVADTIRSQLDEMRAAAVASETQQLREVRSSSTTVALLASFSFLIL